MRDEPRIVVAIAGLIYGRQAAQGQLAEQIQGVGAETIQAVLANASVGGGGVIATVSSIVLVMVGASAVFAQLQMSLNRIWDLQTDPEAGKWATVRQRLLGLVMVVGLGVLVIVTIVVGAFLSSIETFVQNVPAGQWVWIGGNAVVSLGLLTVVFALLFKYIPDAEVERSDVWVGATITAALFSIGKMVLSWYLGQGIGSAYGAAGSLVVLLAWIYYSTLILFLGAEFTQAYARASGREIEPDEHSIRISQGVGSQSTETVE